MSEHDSHDEMGTEAIEAAIRRTRSELDETVEALKDKISPRRIRDEAVHHVREATVGRVEDLTDDAVGMVKGAGNDMLDTIKRNPMPAALAAVGLGWLFMESRNNREHSGRDRYRYGGQGGAYSGSGRFEGPGGFYDAGYRTGAAGGYPGNAYRAGFEYEQGAAGVRGRAEQAFEQVQDKAQHVAQRTGEKASQAADAARHGVHQVAETVGEGVQTVAETVGDGVQQAAGTAREGVQQVAHQAQFGARQVKNRFTDLMDDRPLIIGAAMMALGAVLGFSLPATEKENEVFGEARDKVMERAQEKASETAEKVQQVAHHATTAAKEAVKSDVERQKAGGL